ncbi:UDP-glucose 4-epimerase GalE [Virgibacillus pantothenticus]|uniref:UDP-glucose 4-epimerase n=1 Tax=Virgibacillus pantothenticus TaxID=1473 RepID=A0A0L0QMY3_VIRPA|nr:MULTISPECIES: UDP-glucose 4-epimerase GalE [Virgibacillus]API93317.1 UDP-glucose 4-epimerase GalE [Virgibacillus sp. 6R]KNE19588.1 UDP-glucose 4-epimerase [Virgibacillus pantothenticus]MBS7428632.1 UDP-glucose 4-epimerase GalE [Virgibacillus sp. 19R1-5]MBU8565839.1 UDP-glucose 4-epimerase GalE [Virgibacillus pantothenticus]MBU8599574.1 UDP-glucose 4-epimerase GalE [Virgibacillus pantothenticus]
MSILVLGGAGYIGSHAVYQLIDKGKEVVVVDNLETGHQGAIHPKATFYQGDIRNQDFLRTVFAKESIEAVIHFAANSLVGESMEKPLKYFDNNVYGTQVLLQVMTEYDVKRIVFSSTAATYGEPEAVPITETMPTNPTSTYGETKLTMEKLMKWTEKAHGINYVSLRYFNVAGARETGEIGEDHQPETHLIPIVLQTALGQRDYITIFGDDYDTEDGTCIRDYIHVEDLIAAHLLALDYLQRGGESNVFNLGSSQGFSVKEIIDTAREVTGKVIPAQIGERRAGDPSTLIASSEKAKSVLGWNPERTLITKIIQDAWNWHVGHPNGYEN